MKKNKGITLIALVITIVVLIILAGITINVLIGENGIITKTKEASKLTQKESVKEKVTLLLGEYEILASEEGISLSDFFANKKTAGQIDEIVEDTVDYIIIEVDGYEFTIDKNTKEITGIADINIRITITYPEGTIGSTATAVVTVANNKKTVDTNSLRYGWSNTKTEEPTVWTSFSSGDTLTHSIVGQEIWFLWVEGNYLGGVVGETKTKISNQFNDVDNMTPTISLSKTGDTAGTSNVEITATVSYGFSGVKVVKWEAGQKTETDFGEGLGTILTSPYKFNVDESGWYTVYIEGNNGKKAVSTIQVINMIAKGWRAGTPNAPEMVEGMIPIKYNGTNWVVTTTSDTDWYNYIDNITENVTVSTTTEGQACRKWANVMLSDGTYKADTVAVGQEVTDSELGSMLVWIPRYSYKITSGYHINTAGTIAIKFSSETTDITSGDYIKHPAFTFGEQELKGIWVAKFESSKNGSNIKIAPNVSSWREININTMFTTTRNMEKTNIYGWVAQTGTLETTGDITGDTNTFDTHVMKNTEWGAVAYLAHSIGKTGKLTANTSYITGAGAYKTNISQSTTGNIYGMYDMSGGAWEYVMAVYNNTIGYSGLPNFPAAKYYENYTGFLESYKGVALYETSAGPMRYGGTWDGIGESYIGSSYPWLARGGCSQTSDTPGLFSFGTPHMGMGTTYITFRFVLSK